MAWYDIFIGGDPVTKSGRRARDRDAQPEDREAALHILAEKGTDEALLALCGRFDLQLEHGLKDRKEKDIATDLLVAKGAQGSAAATRHARQSPNFASAVRVVELVEGADRSTALLLELLAAERVEEEFKVEKKRNLLISLAERRHPDIVASAARFLADFDEGVRNAAVEALAAQEGDGMRDALAAALANQREESTRIRGRVAEVFATRRWPVPDGDGWLMANPPPGYRFEGGRVVAGGR
jgi:hypothetical protein